MLVAKVVLPEGPSDKCIKEGDVLVTVNGEILTQFVRLDEILDDNVREKVKISLQRGGEDIEVDIEVGDLHRITPDKFVSVAGASFHTISYQQARRYAIACKGVYVCETSCLFQLGQGSGGWIMHAIDSNDTPDLPTFIKVMKSLPDRAYVEISYKHVCDQNTLEKTFLHIDHRWSRKMELAVRNDATGLWDFTESDDPIIPPITPVPRSASFIRIKNAPDPVADVIHCLVKIWCYSPISLDGISEGRSEALGVVIDHEEGLLVVSRADVPHFFSNIFVVVANSIIVEGEIYYEPLPFQNCVFIKYNPTLVTAPVKSARLSEEMIEQGASTHFVGLNYGYIVHAETTVNKIVSMATIAENDTPRYRATNVEYVKVETTLGDSCRSGVLVAEDGTIQALWLTYLGDWNTEEEKDNKYSLGLGTPTLFPVIEKIKNGIAPKLRTLGVEFESIAMTVARSKGVSDPWINRVEDDNSDAHQLFMLQLWWTTNAMSSCTEWQSLSCIRTTKAYRRIMTHL